MCPCRKLIENQRAVKDCFLLLVGSRKFESTEGPWKARNGSLISDLQLADRPASVTGTYLPWRQEAETFGRFNNSGFFFFFFLNVYFIFETGRDSMNGGGSEREGDTESETGSRLWAVSAEPNAGLELTDLEIITWAEVRCLTDWATRAPQQ